MREVLPDEFRDLDPFTEWALPTERQRMERRNTSEQAELVAFYEAMTADLDRILEYLDATDEEGLTDEGRTLFLMTLSLMDVSLAVENYKQPSVVDGADFRRWIPHQ